MPGIAVDLKFHRFDWERAEQVVKQGASSCIGGFAGLFISLLFGGTVLAAPEGIGHIVCLAVSLLLAAAIILIYKRNNRTDIREL